MENSKKYFLILLRTFMLFVFSESSLFLLFFVIFRTGKVDPSVTREDIIYAKKLHDSSFHPDNGELMTVIGRMSFQVPGNVILTGSMLTFYKLLFLLSCQLHKFFIFLTFFIELNTQKSIRNVSRNE